jgi:uncharacterized membrane protein
MPDLPPPAEPSLLPPEPPETHLRPHVVPWQHAFAWFEAALPLCKRRPWVWIGLAVITLASELGLQLLPDPWTFAGKLIAPLVACGLLLASAAADQSSPPRLGFAFAAFRLPSGAILAILVASLLTFGAEVFAGWWIADVNLLAVHRPDEELTTSAAFGVYTIGVLASLPLTFVPLHVLLEPVGFAEAFAASWEAFVLNTPPLLVYAAISLLLLGLGILTMGLGLVLVLPIWAASSYVAWKDVFGVRTPPPVAAD